METYGRGRSSQYCGRTCIAVVHALRSYMHGNHSRCRQNSSRGGQILQPGNIVTSEDEISLSTTKL